MKVKPGDAIMSANMEYDILQGGIDPHEVLADAQDIYAVQNAIDTIHAFMSSIHESDRFEEM